MTKATDFTLRTADGKDLPLEQYAGRPMLIANTASLCGFTPHYAGLQRVWEAYREQGLVVLAVPSNDFGNQEPGEATACTLRFGVTFPVAAKQHVRGRAATPLFAWLAQEAGWLGRPRWNFYKYVIGRDGHLAAWFGSISKPDGTRLRAAIERGLAPR